MPRRVLPRLLTLDLFRRADAAALRSLYAALLRRIAALEGRLFVFANNGWQPDLVMEEVEKVLRRWPDPAQRPVLFGVPVGVKDVFRTDGYAITCGSLLPPGLFAGQEAPLVSRLRAAGAVVMGLTACTEFTHAEPAATRNPCNLWHTPGGSSSGSAAGVRAGYFPLALGTQTMGSVIRPAAFCGVVGVKPSQGFLPEEGMVHFSPSVDQVGFFCTSVHDAAAVLRLFDSGEAAPPVQARFIIPDDAYLAQAGPAMREAFAHYCVELEALPGVSIRRMSVFPDWPDILQRHQSLTAAELAQTHRHWFPQFDPLYRPRTRAYILRGRSEPPAAIPTGKASCAGLRVVLQGLLDDSDADAFLAPAAMGEAPADLSVTGDPAMNVPWTHAGLPVVGLPMDVGPQGLPLGVQVAGRWGADAALLALAELLRVVRPALWPYRVPQRGV